MLLSFESSATLRCGSNSRRFAMHIPIPMEASMRRFLIWSPIAGVAWYVLLFGILDQSLNRPLNGWVHMSLLYLVPIGLLLCLAARLGLMTPERRTLPRIAMLLLSTPVAALMALQLAGMAFCVAAKECF